jgi:hypothetical protein
VVRYSGINRFICAAGRQHSIIENPDTRNLEPSGSNQLLGIFQIVSFDLLTVRIPPIVVCLVEESYEARASLALRYIDSTLVWLLRDQSSEKVCSRRLVEEEEEAEVSTGAVRGGAATTPRPPRTSGSSS